MATFAVWKGHHLFLEAASQVTTDVPVRFYVVGGPIYRSTGSQVDLQGLKAEARRLGLEGRVGFTGHWADPAAALQSLDVMAAALGSVHFRRDRIALDPAIRAAEEANALVVAEGIPFREAYRRVAARLRKE